MKFLALLDGEGFAFGTTANEAIRKLLTENIIGSDFLNDIEVYKVELVKGSIKVIISEG